MPFYSYDCPTHGTFERRAGSDDVSIPCKCGKDSLRQAIYRPNVVIAGQSMPRTDDLYSVQAEYDKEVKKRGWNYDRALTEIRANRTYDAEGQMYIDTSKMTKEA